MSRSAAHAFRFLAAPAAALGIAWLAGATAAHEPEGHAPEPAASAAPPAASDARFEPPAPGSYALPPFGRVGQHALLAPDGARAPLLELGPGEVAFVSFVYLSCPDACPLATAVLQRLDQALSERPELAARVALVTVSFDPARDTPEAMARHAAALAPRGRWRFLTAASPAELAPLLADFGQDAAPLFGPAGVDTGLLAHVLKVFLVDGRGRIRNAYSTGFLDVRVLWNDALTVLAEDPPDLAGARLGEKTPGD